MEIHGPKQVLKHQLSFTDHQRHFCLSHCQKNGLIVTLFVVFCHKTKNPCSLESCRRTVSGASVILSLFHPSAVGKRLPSFWGHHHEGDQTPLDLYILVPCKCYRFQLLSNKRNSMTHNRTLDPLHL